MNPTATLFGGFDIVSVLPLILIFLISYFLLIRPQQKKQKAHQAMLNALRRGDRVITNGGLIGTVVKIANDAEVQLEIAENVSVRVVRTMISMVMVKGTPLSEEASTPARQESPRKQAKPKAANKPKSTRASKSKS